MKNNIVEFVDIIKNHSELGVVDSKTASLILFEIDTWLSNPTIFSS